MKSRLLLAAALWLGLAPSAQARSLAPGSRYVSLGSSYAAGPRVGDPVEGAPARCGRSTKAYSRLLANRLKLDLVDASCSGATTAHVLGPWNELAPQLDAVNADTRLVTITIGGNDVRFVNNLGAGACTVEQAAGRTVQYCPKFSLANEAEWQALGASMARIAHEVHSRAPRARLVFVDYASIVPASGTCVALGVTEGDAALAQATARRLDALTRKTARENGALLLAASALTRRHDACAADPWSQGATIGPGGVPMHPAIPAHAAIADALERMLAR